MRTPRAGWWERNGCRPENTPVKVDAGEGAGGMWTRSGASGDPCTDEKSAPGEREKVVVRGEILQFGSLEVEQFRVTVRLTAVCGDGAWCVSGAPHVPPSLGLFNRMSWAVAPMGCSHCAAAETEVTGGELRDGQGATWRLGAGIWTLAVGHLCAVCLSRGDRVGAWQWELEARGIETVGAWVASRPQR